MSESLEYSLKQFFQERVSHWIIHLTSWVKNADYCVWLRDVHLDCVFVWIYFCCWYNIAISCLKSSWYLVVWSSKFRYLVVCLLNCCCKSNITLHAVLFVISATSDCEYWNNRTLSCVIFNSETSNWSVSLPFSLSQVYYSFTFPCSTVV